MFRYTLISLDNNLTELHEGLVGCNLKRMEEMDVDTGIVTTGLRSCCGSIRSSFSYNTRPGEMRYTDNGRHVEISELKLTSSYWILTVYHNPDSIRDKRRRDYAIRSLSPKGPRRRIFSTSDLTDIAPRDLRAQLVPPQVCRLLKIE